MAFRAGVGPNTRQTSDFLVEQRCLTIFLSDFLANMGEIVLRKKSLIVFLGEWGRRTYDVSEAKVDADGGAGDEAGGTGD